MGRKKKICAGGFIAKGDLFLFGKRAQQKTWAPGVWDIIGGRAHKNEDIYDALKRETFEEVGIIVQSAELLKITDVWDDADKRFFEYHIYMITLYTGEPVNCSDEHTETAWFSLAQLQTMPLALPVYVELLVEWTNNNNPAALKYQ